MKYPNSLINESSPYLLQHAHNPVNWFPWGQEALNKAKVENKLILVSIGYSACHWCHVMEHESFENEQVAEIMNNHFVCIKVDREERPDIDQLYMNAVQLMNGNGGWPLNCFTLPDQRPVYGGTYFKKEDWSNILLSLAKAYKEDPLKVTGYAERLTDGIRNAELVQLRPDTGLMDIEALQKVYHKWRQFFDYTEGGYSRSPKFPLPNNFLFLLRYSQLCKDDSASVIVHLTLHKMAYGGIYDQLGGGFARYSVDEHWKIPHFEKMLYDNGQLLSLYAEAYQSNKEQLYKEVVYQTIEFVKRELTSPDFGFYSALDADSEGVEGKFYCWTKAELETLLGKDEAIFSTYYNCT